MTFTAKLLDIQTNDTYIAMLHINDLKKYTILSGEQLYLTWHGEKTGISLYIDATSSLVSEGEIGIFKDVWDKHSILISQEIKAESLTSNESDKIITKKLEGETLTKSEIDTVIKDISFGKMTPQMIAFWVAAGFSPGFNFEEIVAMTSSMANNGEILHWDRIAVDKHSVGGVAGKGITPLIISILCCINDIVVPNTSSRAITTASATTDMLETIMKMSFKANELYKFAEESNGFMVWGGGLDLSPADDKIIKIQKPLKTESYDKLTSSIFSKKLAQGLSHVLFDLPYGKYAKLKNLENVDTVKNLFIKIADRFDMHVDFSIREVKGIDGYAVGPNLEVREILRIFEGSSFASYQLLNDALVMAGLIIDMINPKHDSKYIPNKSGIEVARDILVSGHAERKFRQIISMQGGNSSIDSESIKIGHIQKDVFATKSGIIEYINNKLTIDICKSLGNPHSKESGIYFYRKAGDEIDIGERIATLYTVSENRMIMADKILRNSELIEIKDI